MNELTTTWKARREAIPGLTQEKFAELSGVSFSTIGKLDAGFIEDPRHSTIQKIEEGLRKAELEYAARQAAKQQTTGGAQ